jgi:DNA-binding NarL/FixJ family response regulator
MPSRIVLVDDHPIVREGLRNIVERAGFDVVAQGDDGMAAVQLARKWRPDVMVMDVSMPRMNGVDAARAILAADARMPIVLLTVHVDELRVLAALRCGVRGYVSKTQPATELVDAIREVLNGGTYLSPRVSGVVMRAYLADRAPAADPLTPRERQVLQLVAEGQTTKDVAATLDLTVKTAEYYRLRIMQKLGIHTTAGLVRYAIRSGIAHLV